MKNDKRNKLFKEVASFLIRGPCRNLDKECIKWYGFIRCAIVQFKTKGLKKGEEKRKIYIQVSILRGADS